MSSSQPPESNPILTSYQAFVENTPLVTRYILNSLTISYVLSFFVDFGFAVANIPLFTIGKFEIYRLILCNIVCEGLLSLIFAYFSFNDMGKRLEYSLGSTAFSYLFLLIGTLTNIAFLFLMYFMYYLSGNKLVLMQASAGIWNILLGLIAVECTAAPAGGKRRLFVVDVPVLYYPVSLFFLFILFSGFRISLAFSTGIGYLYGFGYLDRFKLSQSTFTRWENGFLKNFTERKGWVTGTSATGASAWAPLTQDQESQDWSPSSFFQGQPATSRSNDQNAQADNSASRWTNSSPGKVKKPSFPGSGVSLGTPTQRTNTGSSHIDARLAMLEAAERRAQENNEVKRDV